MLYLPWSFIVHKHHVTRLVMYNHTTTIAYIWAEWHAHNSSVVGFLSDLSFLTKQVRKEVCGRFKQVAGPIVAKFMWRALVSAWHVYLVFTEKATSYLYCTSTKNLAKCLTELTRSTGGWKVLGQIFQVVTCILIVKSWLVNDHNVYIWSKFWYTATMFTRQCRTYLSVNGILIVCFLLLIPR